MKETIFKELGEAYSTETWAMNQVIIYYQNGRAFFSYGKLIAVQMHDGRLALTELHDYSKTTSKYCTRFTGMSTKERRTGIENKSIINL